MSERIVTITCCYDCPYSKNGDNCMKTGRDISKFIITDSLPELLCPLNRKD